MVNTLANVEVFFSFLWGKNNFDISNVLPLTRCKNKRLAEHEEFSDVEDYEDEESDVEDFFFPCESKKAEDWL